MEKGCADVAKPPSDLFSKYELEEAGTLFDRVEVSPDTPSLTLW